MGGHGLMGGGDLTIKGESQHGSHVQGQGHHVVAKVVEAGAGLEHGSGAFADLAEGVGPFGLGGSVHDGGGSAEFANMPDRIPEAPGNTEIPGRACGVRICGFLRIIRIVISWPGLRAPPASHPQHSAPGSQPVTPSLECCMSEMSCRGLRLRPLNRALLSVFVPFITCAAFAQGLHAAETDVLTLSPVRVEEGRGVEEAPSERSGRYTVRRSRSATGLNLSLKDTPQSVSVLTRAEMNDFRLNSVNEALAASSGVMVEKVETDRTYYTARGFDITSFQVDGVGVPFAYGNVYGDLDTALYDRVEVVYGANGLTTGTGYPAATVNFVRKRPTPDFQASAGLKLGSWNSRRLDGDVSGALVESGRLRGRLG